VQDDVVQSEFPYPMKNHEEPLSNPIAPASQTGYHGQSKDLHPVRNMLSMLLFKFTLD